MQRIGIILNSFSKVILSKKAKDVIVKAAKIGFEVRYKEERIGILFGYVQRKVVYVKRATPYKASIAFRTCVEVDKNIFTARVKRLQSKYKLRYLGNFHTHNQVANSISSALSSEDKKPICENSFPVIEIVVCIWTSNSPVQQSQYYLQIRDEPYRIRIAAYLLSGAFPILPVFCKGADDA